GGYICLKLEEQAPPSDASTREHVESYLKSHYSLAEVRIRHLVNHFYVVLPENKGCKPCYYHIVAVTESGVTEPFVFYGTGMMATWDSPWWMDKHLGDEFTFYYFEQPDKSYLFAGFPRLGTAPLVSLSTTKLPCGKGP